MQVETVYIWSRYFPDYTERMEQISAWCRVHMASDSIDCLSLVPME